MDLTWEGVYEDSFEMLFSHDSLILLWWPCVLDMMLKVQLLTGTNLFLFFFFWTLFFFFFSFFYKELATISVTLKVDITTSVPTSELADKTSSGFAALSQDITQEVSQCTCFVFICYYSAMWECCFILVVCPKKKKKKWGAQFMWEIWTVQWSLVWLSVWPARHTKNRIVTNFFINK